MKLFALYLPQFHEIPENNLWWGDGFTEWDKVRAALPLFRGHRQPKLPLSEHYYNLLDPDTLPEQVRLAHAYGVDGFVYYHYYFRGKLLLEKPAEQLLREKEIPLPFFFCWANHSWYRAHGNSKDLLIEQVYGTESDWEAHFQYLLPFFRDGRYEKHDGKPLLMIFNNRFPEKHAWCAFMDRRCRESGFEGISVIETIGTLPNAEILRDCTEQTDYLYLREPNTATYIYKERVKYTPRGIYLKLQKELGKHGFRSCVNRFSGNALYDAMIRREPKQDSRLIHGAFFEWDNTPRHGSRGFIITPPSKERFFAYMDSVATDDYVVINAWNEWAEGMMLEPTANEGYRYLEWIKEWKQTQTTKR